MSKRNCLRVSAVLTCFALGLLGQDAKPNADAKSAETIKVDTHHSRWNYPKEVVVPAGRQLCLVRKGDTLWDLARKFLGNPYSWPQIWELNNWVKDAHWIYPGDPLIVDGSRTALAQASPDSPKGSVPPVAPTTAGATPATTGAADPSATPPQAQAAADGTPDLAEPEVANLAPDSAKKRAPLRIMREELAYSFQDYIQMPFLAPKGEAAYLRENRALRIVGKKNTERLILGDGELFYLNGGSDRGLRAGDRFLLVKLVKKDLYHPEDQNRRRPLGDILQQVGVARIMTVQGKGSVAIVEKCMDPVMVGQLLVPFTEPSNVPLKMRTDIQDPVQVKDLAKILFTRDDHQLTGQGEMVIVDKGHSDGLKVGDVLLGIRYQSFPVTEARRATDRLMEKTNHYIGQCVVTFTTANSATCRIVRSSDPFRIGDVLTR
jgi:hypothetical protein